jgi:hypothetical protein
MSIGGLATIIVLRNDLRPIALRHRLSPGLPLSDLNHFNKFRRNVNIAAGSKKLRVLKGGTVICAMSLTSPGCSCNDRAVKNKLRFS